MDKNKHVTEEKTSTQSERAKEARLTKPIKDTETLQELMSVYKRGSRDYLLLAVGLNTGLRISDILPLTLGDLSGSTFTIVEQKTRKKTTISLNNDLRALVFDTAEIEQVEDAKDYFFFNRRDRSKHISRSQAFRIVDKAGDMIGINISPHSLRKTFGYIHYKRTKDIAQLMYVFNHSAPNVTMRYIGMDEESAFENIYSHSIGL